MTDLRTRLEALRQAIKGHENRNPEIRYNQNKTFSAPQPFLDGWERAGEYTFRHTESIPLDPNSNMRVNLQDGANYFLSCSLDQLYWFDTETTGLSGGAGTVIFLFGIAQVTSSQIVVQQFFLTDFPGEAEFLHLLLDSIPFSGDTRFLSYNGSAYDSPLLKTRFLLQRLPPPPICQLDLLYLVRRLWKKSLPDCSLGTVERFVLDRERSTDLPGRMIPQVYFEYLRSGALTDIQRVVEHHRNDLLSLIHLFDLLGSLVREPTVKKGLDATALGVLAVTLNPTIGWQFLKELARRGDPAAIERISKRSRWEGKHEEGEHFRAPYVREFYPVALEELKYLEHVRRDYEGALELAQFWLSKDLPSSERADLSRRVDRLRKKQGIRQTASIPSTPILPPDG